MSWDKAGERSKAAGTGGLFASLKDDGEKMIVVFCGEPFVKEIVFNEKLDRYEDFDEKAHTGKTSTPHFKLNVYVLAQGKKPDPCAALAKPEMKIFEMNNSTFKDVLKAKEKYGLDNWSFEVERAGKKGDKKATYSVLPEAKLDDAQKKAIAEFKLHDLSKSGDDAGDSKTDMGSHDKAKSNGNGKAAPAGDAQISTEDSQALVARLKKIPKEKIQGFLAKFGVAQVKLLKAGDLAAARTYVDELDPPAKPAEKPAEPAEVDPFA